MIKKIVIISSDVVDNKMAGVGIRYWEIATSLSQEFDVTLLCPLGSKLFSENFHIVEFDYKTQNVKEYIYDASVIIISGFTLHFHPYLKELDIPLAVDLYVPFMMESLIWHKNDDLQSWIPDFEEFLRVQNELLREGDFFFCANERQRDLWIGMLLANKRINPHQILLDETLKSLINIVPFGIRLPDSEDKSNKNVFAKYGIPENSKIIIWSGGVWDWLDPITLIHAFRNYQELNDEVVLFFMGSDHPNNLDVKMSLTFQCKALSSDMGLLGKKIFFGDWIPYNERWDYLRSADLCVLTFRNHIETRFSNRTRLIDCLGANLPVVVTTGDFLGEELAKVGLAEIVPPGDTLALAHALEKMLGIDRKLLSDKFLNFAKRYQWEKSIEPLVEFCLNSKFASDKGKYLTDVERISKDKDNFLNKVIKDKDEFLQKVIEEKDEFLQKVIEEKDEFLENVIKDKDEFFQKAIDSKECLYKKVFEEKDELMQKIIEERDRIFNFEISELRNEIRNQKLLIEKYQKFFLFRLYRKLRNF